MQRPLALPERQALPVVPLTWAERLKCVFGIEITLCPLCSVRLVIAEITDPEVIDRILEQVRREGLPGAPPEWMPSD